MAPPHHSKIQWFEIGTSGTDHQMHRKDRIAFRFR